MAVYRIWPSTDGPASSVTDNQPLNLAMEFRSTPGPTWATHLHFYRGDDTIVGPIVGRLWMVDTPSSGTVVPGSDVTFTLSGTGWHTVALPSPIPLDSALRYKVAVTFPDRWTLTGGYWTSGPGATGITNGPLTAYSAADASAGQGTFSTGAGTTFPGSSGAGGNYWVDVTVTDVDPTAAVTPPSISSTATVGAPTASPGATTVSPASISPTAAIGTPTAVPGAATIAPAPVDPTATLGGLALIAGLVTIPPDSIGAASIVGTPLLLSGVSLPSISSTATVGAPTAGPGPVGLAPSSVGTASIVGAPVLNPASQRPESLEVVIGPPLTGWVLGILEVA